MDSCRIFILSPANATGRRADILLSPRAGFQLAMRFQNGGAPIGEVFSFLSGLYFRGKLSYATHFARTPAQAAGVLIITSNRGLLPVETMITPSELVAFRDVPINCKESRYVEPLRKTAVDLVANLPSPYEIVLLGSVGTKKYAGPLLKVFNSNLKFPSDFVGRGDMSRGGLLLRCVDEDRELAYVPLDGAIVHGKRPPKLEKRTPLQGQS